MSGAPLRTVRAPNGLVASADHLATSAGVAVLADGGNPLDAALATNAVLAVTGPHLCGMGGDLFALVHVDGDIVALDASGRAGSGADAAALRDAGHTTMPFRLHPAAITVPGCVDGWIALHERFGSLPLERLLAPAAGLAEHGFPASPLLVGSLHNVGATARHHLSELSTQATRPGVRVRRPGTATALRSIAADGRDGFYGGAFGAGLLAIAEGQITAADLATSQADWVAPLSASALGVDLHTVPPGSQGYLTLGACRLAERLDLPDDPRHPRWANLLIEAAVAAAADRPAVLHDEADGEHLLQAIDDRLADVDPGRASRTTAPAAGGDTTYLCAAGLDRAGRAMAVSLIQSNASGFGSHLVEPSTGINLHNRGIGFSLEPGHPAELTPGRRPPHTLSPVVATRGADLAAVFGTMGGDAQPQILLQLAVRMFHHGQTPARAIDAGRWALRAETGFDTWTSPGTTVVVEEHAADEWAGPLRDLGHRVEIAPSYDSAFGHAQAITVDRHGMFAGAADPRAVIGSCAGR